MLVILVESALRSVILGSVVWIGLNLFRVRNPHVQMTCWVVVLVASLSMPVLMHWTTVTVTLEAVPLPAPQAALAVQDPLPDSMLRPEIGAPASSQPGLPAAAHEASAPVVNWWALATAVYASIAGLLLVRLAVGVYLTWRLTRAAKPIDDPWTAPAQV